MKESGQRYERELSDAESNLEKSRLKYESATEEWERMNSNASFTNQSDGFGKMKKSSSLSIVKSFRDRIQKELRVLFLNQSVSKITF